MANPARKRRNISSLDDDQTQAALRFLMKLDQVLKFQDARLHEAVKLGLGAVMRNQFPNGAWSQGFDVPNIDQPKDLKASYPIPGRASIPAVITGLTIP